MNIRASVTSFCLAIALVTAPALSQENEPAWVPMLKNLLAGELNCELNYLTNVREFDLGGTLRIDARAHCVDGRAFDVMTDKDGENFEIRACKPLEC